MWTVDYIITKITDFMCPVSEADKMFILTLPLMVSGDLVTGGLWSVFSSICHPITVMLPTRSLSADL